MSQSRSEKYLQNLRRDPNQVNEINQNGLFTSDDEDVKLFLKYGADPNHADNEGNTPIFFTNPLGTTLLLNAGADPNHTNNLGQNALFTMYGGDDDDNLEKVEILYNAGIDLFVIDNEGKTALFKTYGKVIPYLLSMGLDPKHTDNNGDNVLFRDGISPENVQHFLDYGVNPNHTNNDGQNALFFIDEDAKQIKSLLKAGADPNHVDKNGNTPMMEFLQGYTDQYFENWQFFAGNIENSTDVAKQLIMHGSNDAEIYYEFLANHPEFFGLSTSNLNDVLLDGKRWTSDTLYDVKLLYGVLRYSKTSRPIQVFDNISSDKELKSVPFRDIKVGDNLDINGVRYSADGKSSGQYVISYKISSRITWPNFFTDGDISTTYPGIQGTVSKIDKRIVYLDLFNDGEKNVDSLIRKYE